jgi:hypothetical protein
MRYGIRAYFQRSFNPPVGGDNVRARWRIWKTTMTGKFPGDFRTLSEFKINVN